MNERKQRIEALFDAALELSLPEQREVFLDRATGDDPQLRAEVRELVQAYEKAGDFLAATSGPAAAQHDPAEKPTQSNSTVDEQVGAVIGRYKLLQKIGEGGCGVVYMAEQEEPVRRRVALKIIKLGMDTKSVIARFEAERQALALMDHPNIAKVLDGGATETPLAHQTETAPEASPRRVGEGQGVRAGRPYFVMELVRGVKITDYCDQKNLSTQERLDLFINVCQAVQHAHQKGIIHRDLKPSNILVSVNDGVAVPKVIDFGIAKATSDQRLTDKTVFTAFEQFIGTPAYMSPEQAELTNVDIDTRSDIYSLGVLLYELLTGKTPFDAKELLQAGLDQMRRTLREKEPARPSTRVSTLGGEELTTTAKRRGLDAPKLVNTLRGDLDWIVMKCLEKDRARRYETANGLATDIQRHLSNEPVVACPPSTLYRFQKMVRRNKAAFAAAVTIVALLVGGVGASTWEAVRARRAEQQQARLLRQAQENENKAEANERKAQNEAEKSDQVAQFLGSILQGVGPSVALGRDTTVLREILDKAAARISTELTNNPEAESSLRNSLASVYWQLGQLGKAEAMQREALAVAEKTYGNDDPETGYMHFWLAAVLREANRNDEAEVEAREALAIFRKMPDGPKKDHGMGLALQALSNALGRQDGRLEEAADAGREALGRMRTAFGSNSVAFATQLNNLANIVRNLGDPAQAETMLRESLAICSRNHVSEGDVAMKFHNLALALELEGKLAEAEETRRKRVATLEKLAAADAEERQNMSSSLVNELGNLARVLQREGKAEQADAARREALARSERIAESLANAAKPLTPDLLRSRAYVFAGLGRWREAAADFTRYRETAPDDDQVWETLAAALVQTGDLEAYRRHCRDGFERFRNTRSPRVADRVAKACLILPDSGVDLKGLAAMANAALTLERGSMRMPWRQFCKALAEYRQGNFTEAAHWSQEALSHPSDALEPTIWPLNANSVERDAAAYSLLAMAQHWSGREPDAKLALSKGIEILKTELPKLGLNRDLETAVYAGALMREAKALIEGQTPGGIVQRPGSGVQSRTELPAGSEAATNDHQPKSE